MEKNTRIELNDTVADVVGKLSENVPGATAVCTSILNESEYIDPDGTFGGFGILLLLDTFNIYGRRIWNLYKDVCKEDLIKTIAVIRACQLGILKRDKLQSAINEHGKGIDVDELYLKVKEMLPNFAGGITIVKQT